MVVEVKHTLEVGSMASGSEGLLQGNKELFAARLCLN